MATRKQAAKHAGHTARQTAQPHARHKLRQTAQQTAAYLMVAFGLALLTVSFLVPPLGTIDPSVLAAFGEILTFSGSVIGMDSHYRYKSSTGRYNDYYVRNDGCTGSEDSNDETDFCPSRHEQKQ